VGGSVA